MNFPKITKSLLNGLSLRSTYSRGQDYYERRVVSNVTYDTGTDVISAIVSGNRRYSVTIKNVSEKPDFYCTCPVLDDICKHGVATGLEVINHPQTIELKRRKSKRTKNEPDFGTLFKNASSQQKEEFLFKILTEDNNLRNRFLSLIMGQISMESEKSVESIRDALTEAFNRIDFSYEASFDYEVPHSRYGYRDDWEIHTDYAEKELEDALAPFQENIHSHLKSGNIVDASKVLLGIYEGILQADNLKLDTDYDLFPDGVVDRLLDFFIAFVKEYVEWFSAVEKQEDALVRISELFFERLSYYRETATSGYSSDEDEYFDEDDENQDWRTFEDYLEVLKPFLKELVTGKTTARHWHSMLDRYDLVDSTTDEIQLKIAEMLEDGTIWLKTAEVNYKNNRNITRQLLDFYLREGKTKDFIRIGKFALKKWENHFDRYLYENLDSNADPGFFSTVMTHCAIRERNVDLFKQYKKQFGEPAARDFIHQLEKNAFGELKRYYIQLLEVEEDYAAILEYAKKNRGDWDINFLVTPILNVYPSECFSIIREKTDRFLKENIGRKYYRVAAGWLRLLLHIKEDAVRRDALNYFDSLFHTYKNRRALKDELRQVGITA